MPFGADLRAAFRIGQTFHEVRERPGIYDRQQRQQERGNQHGDECPNTPRQWFFGPRENVHAEKARDGRADETERRHDCQTRHRIVLSPQCLVFEKLAHFLNLLTNVVIEPVELEMRAAEREEFARLCLVADGMKPVSVREAKKGLQRPAGRRAERLHGGFIVRIEATHRLRQLIGEHQQRGFVKMREKKNQKMLVAKAILAAVADIGEEGIVGVAGDDKSMSA